MRRPFLAVLLLATFHLDAQEFTEADEAAVRALHGAYIDAWIRNDAEGVMNTLAPDAVIVPSGRLPLSGAEIPQFWWPAGSKTEVLSYTTEVKGVQGSGNLAYLWGTGDLRFRYEQDGSVSEIRSRSVFTMIARRDGEGRWRTIHRSWSDLPR
jgi:uncharacterized protein (TIGR02246 family)